LIEKNIDSFKKFVGFQTNGIKRFDVIIQEIPRTLFENYKEEEIFGSKR